MQKRLNETNEWRRQEEGEVDEERGRGERERS